MPLFLSELNSDDEPRRHKQTRKPALPVEMKATCFALIYMTPGVDWTENIKCLSLLTCPSKTHPCFNLVCVLIC